jgi:ubiquinone/menaquinone biosynthesis C-methylase UbiE
MKQVSPKVYNKEYYLNVCLGHEEYKKNNGGSLNIKWEKLIENIPLRKGMSILDLGCGRGDLCFYLAKKGMYVRGIDYSADAIELAREQLKKQPLEIRNRIQFEKLDAKKINYKTSSFDAIISLDVFEHLFKEELELVMKKISQVLKKEGILLVHTETNRIYLDYTHKYYSYPLDSFLTRIYNFFLNRNYKGLPKDLRNSYHKTQHVNEPTIFYLNNLFKRHSFKGNIISVIGGCKPLLSWKDYFYNTFICFFPLSRFFPLSVLFATEYICLMRNKKE